jgi:hypothetical protein
MWQLLEVTYIGTEKTRKKVARKITNIKRVWHEIRSDGPAITERWFRRREPEADLRCNHWNSQ